jgi:hypothetical protein
MGCLLVSGYVRDKCRHDDGKSMPAWLYGLGDTEKCRLVSQQVGTRCLFSHQFIIF